MFKQFEIRKILFRIIFLSIFYHFSYATVTNCEQFYRDKQYQKAFVACNNIIKDNSDITGAAIIGLMFYHGYMVQQDFTKATVLFNKSKNWFLEQAQAGNVDAMQALGIMYHVGNYDIRYDCGVTRDLGKSFHWFSQAAERGDVYSQERLGVFYITGRDGVARDYNKAFYWYKKAADMNYAPAQSGLGSIYQYGLGVTSDDKKACYWYKKAALQGDKDAKKYLNINKKCK